MARTRRRRGFTLIELLIALMLTSLLLTAIATAMHAAMTAHEENTELASMTQTARVLLMRMRREVRTAAAVDHSAAANRLVIIPPDDGSGLQEISYEYDAGTKVLAYRRVVNGTASVQTVLDGTSQVMLTAFQVTHTVAQDDQGVDYTRRTVVQLTFAADNQTASLTCSASPRRNQSY